MKRDKFAKRYAVMVTAFGCLFLVAYLFAPPLLKISLGEDSKTILGFVLGTMITTALNWSIGTSKTSEDKTYLGQPEDVEPGGQE